MWMMTKLGKLSSTFSWTLYFCVFVFSSGVHWGAPSGLPPHYAHTAAAAGPAGCSGSQTAAVWRLTWHCGATKHNCGPGKES